MALPFAVFISLGRIFEWDEHGTSWKKAGRVWNDTCCRENERWTQSARVISQTSTSQKDRNGAKRGSKTRSSPTCLQYDVTHWPAWPSDKIGEQGVHWALKSHCSTWIMYSDSRIRLRIRIYFCQVVIWKWTLNRLWRALQVMPRSKEK